VKKKRSIEDIQGKNIVEDFSLSPKSVCNFLAACYSNVVPLALFGSSKNYRIVLKKICNYVNLFQGESFTWHDMLLNLKVAPFCQHLLGGPDDYSKKSTEKSVEVLEAQPTDSVLNATAFADQDNEVMTQMTLNKKRAHKDTVHNDLPADYHDTQNSCETQSLSCLSDDSSYVSCGGVTPSVSVAQNVPNSLLRRRERQRQRNKTRIRNRPGNDGKASHRIFDDGIGSCSRDEVSNAVPDDVVASKKNHKQRGKRGGRKLHAKAETLVEVSTPSISVSETMTVSDEDPVDFSKRKNSDQMPFVANISEKSTLESEPLSQWSHKNKNAKSDGTISDNRQKIKAEVILLQLLKFFFNEFVTPLLKRNFSVVTTQGTGKHCIYFRKCDWRVLQSLAELELMKTRSCEKKENERESSAAKHHGSCKNTLMGHPFRSAFVKKEVTWNTPAPLSLLDITWTPKASKGMRPLIDMRSRNNDFRLKDASQSGSPEGPGVDVRAQPLV